MQLHGARLTPTPVDMKSPKALPLTTRKPLTKKLPVSEAVRRDVGLLMPFDSAEEEGAPDSHEG